MDFPSGEIKPAEKHVLKNQVSSLRVSLGKPIPWDSPCINALQIQLDTYSDDLQYISSFQIMHWTAIIIYGWHFYFKLYTRDFRARISITTEKKKYQVKRDSESENSEELLFFKHFNFSANQLLFERITHLAYLALVRVIAGQPKCAASTSKF